MSGDGGVAPSAAFPRSGGGVAGLIRTHDWASSPLGRPEAWPTALKVAVNLILDSPDSMFLAWGPELRFFYNDAYRQILGARDGRSIGAPIGSIWPEVWEQVRPIAERALAGEASRFESLPLVMPRQGREETTYWTFSYSPLRDETGAIRGLFCVGNEITERLQSERALRESEARNRQIVDSAVDYAIIATDLEGRITRWNEGARRILGWSEAEVLGVSPELFFTPEDRAAGGFAAQMRAALARGRSSSEHWRLRKSGERFWASGELTPLFGGDGQAEGFVKLVRDRTSQHLANQALLRSEARLRRAQEAGKVGLFAIGVDDTRLYGTPEFCRIFGLPELESMPAASVEDLVIPEDRPTVSNAQTRQSGEAVLEVEYRIRRADTGEVRSILRRAEYERDATGRPVRLVGAVQDVTDQRRARDALAELNATLEARVEEQVRERERIWRNSRDLLVVVGPDGLLRAVNPAWKTILGHDPDEVVGRSYLDFIWPDDIEAAQGALTAALQDPLINFEIRLRHVDGTPRWLSWTTSFEGEFIYAYGRHITAEKIQAAALADAQDRLRQSHKMEAVGQLTGGIAHDFNNLLTGVTGALDMLRRRLQAGRTDDLLRFMDAASVSAQRAAALTHRLLAFARRQSLDTKPQDVNRLVIGMEELLRRTLGDHIILEVALEEGLWPALCDANQLENAILNLAINARDAMPDGGRLGIETSSVQLDDSDAREIPEVSPGDYVAICVADTGTGMTPEVLAKAFDPFFTTKPIGQGTGLGLSMIYGFAKQSAGHVRIESEVDRGTVFTLYLPRAAAAEAAVETGAGQAPCGQGETVLIVEDDPTVRLLVVEVLDDLGYLRIEAVDSRSALPILESDCRIDLLITDVGLPHMNGCQLAEAARVIRPELKVLFITGYAEDEALRGGRLAPGMAMMTKPFALDQLGARIRQMIEG